MLRNKVTLEVDGIALPSGVKKTAHYFEIVIGNYLREEGPPTVINWIEATFTPLIDNLAFLKLKWVKTSVPRVYAELDIRFS